MNATPPRSPGSQRTWRRPSLSFGEKAFLVLTAATAALIASGIRLMLDLDHLLGPWLSALATAAFVGLSMVAVVSVMLRRG